jgi:hypothetical protein
MSATTAQIALLHHTLGVTPERRQPYRNHFVAGDGHHDMPDLVALETVGMMVRGPAPKFCPPGDIVFVVTEAGRDFALDNLPQPPKRSKYWEFLDADYGHSFAEWLGIEMPELQNSNYGIGSCYCSLPDHYRYLRREFTRGERWSPEVVGEWKPTMKEAKASYKAALKARKAQQKAWAAA